MKRFLAITGIAIFLAPSMVLAVPTAPPVFGTVSSLVEGEQLPEGVADFVASVIGSMDPKPLWLSDVSPESGDVQEVVKKGISVSLCVRLHLSWLQCPQFVSAVHTIVQREAEVKRLGHELQTIATSNEDPISQFSLLPKKLAATYSEILDIWGLPQDPETGLLQSVHILPPPDDMEGGYQPLTDAVGGLTPQEAAIAGIWRYQYGLEFVKRSLDDGGSDSTDPDGQSGEGTERQYLFARPDAVESALDQLLQELDGQKPELSQGEVVLYLIPVTTNVIAWAYFRDTTLDRDDVHNLPEKDAGLQWQMAVEPVVPSILTEDGEPILGGKYPPPPERKENGSPSEEDDADIIVKGGGGLCESLSGSQGFLCRERQNSPLGAGCLEGPPDPKEDTIILSPCPPEEAPDTTFYCCDNGCSMPLKKCEHEQTHATQSECLDDPACYTYDTTTTMCKQQMTQEQLHKGDYSACTPGTETAYNFTILGHACFIRDCARRTYGHSIVPGRDPLVSEQTAAPWLQCMAPPENQKTIKVPPLATMPYFPAYNPHARSLELDISYCQTGGKPPLMLPTLCQPPPQQTLSLLTTLQTVVSLTFKQNTDTAMYNTMLLSLEGQGMEAASTLFNGYLRKASETLDGSLQGTVDLLQQLANGTFPMKMCPLNPQDDPGVCTWDGSPPEEVDVDSLLQP